MRRTNIGTGNGNSIIDEQNENLISQLHQQTNALKSLTIHIGEEVRCQNNFLQTAFMNDVDKVDGVLKSSMSKLGQLAKQNPSKLILYLIMFAFLIFFLCWVIIKLK